jgi:hypothetical protein
VSDPDYLNANLLNGLGDGCSSREEEEEVAIIHEGSKTLHKNMQNPEFGPFGVEEESQNRMFGIMKCLYFSHYHPPWR